MTDAPSPCGGSAAVRFLEREAPWLFDPKLATCIVGSTALAIACEREGIPGPEPADLDLAWGLDVSLGEALLRHRGVFLPSTSGNLDRGTLAMKLGGRRIEVTAFRAGSRADPVPARIEADLRARDMTIGALAFELATGRVHDPLDGLSDYRARRVAPAGEAAERVREHPIRWLRYVRKAHELGFDLDRGIRSLRLDPRILRGVPAEAVSAEIRAALQKTLSPGRFFHELHEIGVLRELSEELDGQFDGRPAGPQRWHPEISQALHLVLSLDWARRHLDLAPEGDRLAVMVSVLLHDLGKSLTNPRELPGHPGHERKGIRPLRQFLARWKGLADQRAEHLAIAVCELHVEIRHLCELRKGTMVKLYDRTFRGSDFPVEAFALAVAADSGGRLGHSDSGEDVYRRLLADIRWLRERCASVDAKALREQYPELKRFKAALHQARCQALSGRPDRSTPAADGPPR
ncbi:MAG: hypothetical protein Fur0037_01840 [Planctomycetota bacterium]